MTAHPQRPPRVLLYGGTFNPVHNGHVSVLWQVQNALQADVVQVVPCHLPPHKQAPTAPNSHRLAMLTLALQELNAASGCQRFVLNTCELDRQGVSYTLHTLQAARQHWGADARLVWLLGMDSWQQLATWHRWQDLFPLTHFVVVERPGGRIGPASSICTRQPYSLYPSSSYGKALRGRWPMCPPRPWPLPHRPFVPTFSRACALLA